MSLKLSTAYRKLRIKHSALRTRLFPLSTANCKPPTADRILLFPKFGSQFTPVDTKIAVVSDIHGNMPALNAVLEDIYRNDIRMIINLGDSVYGPLWPEETALAIQHYEMISVIGNEDEIILNKSLSGQTLDYVRSRLSKDSKEWMRTIPFSYVMDEDLVAFHGTGLSNHDYLVEKVIDVPGNEVVIKSEDELALELKSIDQKIILSGHSHMPRYIRLPGDRYIINPGSVGLPAYHDDKPFFHKMENNDPSARYAILEINGDDVILVPKKIRYDFQQSALQARKNGREDWYQWLMTGKAG
jgi:putative phosphoesterase